jgi:hypothetical protein
MAALQRYGSNAKSPYELAPGAPAPKPADRVIFVEVRSKATRSVLLNLEILVGSGVVTVSSRNSAPETFDSVIGSLREIVADSRCPEVRVVEGIETPGEFAKAISRNL